MDINLNGQMDGVRAARHLFQLVHVPIIFVTTLCDDNLPERAKSAQPYGYLLKPFTDLELTSHVERALDNHRIKRSIRIHRPPQRRPPREEISLVNCS